MAGSHDTNDRAGRGGDQAPPPTRALLLERPASHGDRVRDALERAILDGTLKQGRPLVERELAEMLGTSKTPVREALKQLRSSGLVEANSHLGARVRTLDAQTVRDLFSARALVEPEAVRLAVQRAGSGPNTQARAELREAETHAADGDLTALGLANRRFHYELYRQCGNKFLVEFLAKLRNLATFVATAGWQISASFVSELSEHAEILATAEAGDAEGTANLVREHIQRAVQALLSSLEGHQNGEDTT